ncbi:acyl-CoA dehydratase activase-related protein [Syntrophomonas wolfei]|jgi:predicted nucleotide-binding protein (sugar kinase/HSP70/actin superfamily)|uniref:acyl-CoA dehydratase activase-related protein n=1 Tax=Syntrophomonas wolfei TaxID=863 RepID=UPI000774097C|nr:acyl-CoA dehydratase activase-related protein [Syntrophomonas wolfei]
MSRVGIPRSLFYYYYYPLWKSFFLDLGVEVLTSSPSNRNTVERGIELAVDETCFPIKVYLGHVAELCREEPDYLFVPRLVSVEARSYICPKFMGLPDMVRALIKDTPPLIDITVDLSRDEKCFKKDIIRVGRLFTRQVPKIQLAYQHGCEELRLCRSLASQGFTMEEAIKIWEGGAMEAERETDLNIGVLGHGYSLYDERISMNLVKRLRAMNCKVLLPEHLGSQEVEAEAATVPKRVFWTLGRKMLGSALHLSQREDVDGIIYLACFGCGPDSLVGEIIERKIRDKKPFILLTVDEHSGEAGIITRLEAFCDMLRRRRNCGSESKLSPYGASLHSFENTV